MEPLLSTLQRCISSGEFERALSVADELLAQSKRNFNAWLGRASANLNLGRLIDADEDLEHALRLSPADPQANLLRGMVEQRLGRVDPAIDRLTRLADGASPQAIEAGIALGETLFFAHRRDAFAAFVQKGGAWSTDPRGAMMLARVQARSDAAAAIATLLRMVGSGASPLLRRVAGFEAVQLLDKAGRYREAFDLATRLHRELTPPFDVEGLIGDVRMQKSLIEQYPQRCAPRIDPVQGVALIAALPRSGTTLLEQMLDRHPAIAGIGEYEGIDRIGEGVVSSGRWPKGLHMLPREQLLALQTRYLHGASRLKRSEASWSFDKTLEGWRWIVAVAQVLPGAVLFRVTREPRDMALSMFLSYFHPQLKGWTGNLGSIQRVIAAERELLPSALVALGMKHQDVVYEELVAQPEAHAIRALEALSLPMDAKVLAPESNTRAVFTLSHEQVRRPINATSIGRWKNYEFAFDSSWEGL